MDFDSFSKAGVCHLGSGALLICDEDTCVVDLAKTCCLNFFRKESCGKCNPCRIGTQREPLRSSPTSLRVQEP